MCDVVAYRFFWSYLEETIMPGSRWHQPMTMVYSDMGWKCGLNQAIPTSPSLLNMYNSD